MYTNFSEKWNIVGPDLTYFRAQNECFLFNAANPSLNINHDTIKYFVLSYNLSGLANQIQALRQNTSRYFIPKMSVFNTSKVLCNSHVMFVYVIIVNYC